jgi:hypothetical protein
MNPMRNKSSISFEIPVPWAATPACIKATGTHAVIVAGVVAIITLIVVALS